MASIPSAIVTLVLALTLGLAAPAAAQIVNPPRPPTGATRDLLPATGRTIGGPGMRNIPVDTALSLLGHSLSPDFAVDACATLLNVGNSTIRFVLRHLVSNERGIAAVVTPGRAW